MDGSTRAMNIQKVGDAIRNHFLTSSQDVVLGAMAKVSNDSISVKMLGLCRITARSTGSPVVTHRGSNVTRGLCAGDLLESLSSIL